MYKTFKAWPTAAISIIVSLTLVLLGSRLIWAYWFKHPILRAWLNIIFNSFNQGILGNYCGYAQVLYFEKGTPMLGIHPNIPAGLFGWVSFNYVNYHIPGVGRHANLILAWQQ